MDEELDQLLTDLKLHRMREIVTAEIERATKEKPSWARFLAGLLREENAARRERSLAYRIEQARLPERWSLTTFPFDRQPGVDPTAVRTLAELEFVAQARNIVFIGPTGVGKTGIASAILLRALENGHRGLFIRAQDLFDEMYASLADRSTRALLDRLRRVDHPPRVRGVVRLPRAEADGPGPARPTAASLHDDPHRRTADEGAALRASGGERRHREHDRTVGPFG